MSASVPPSGQDPTFNDPLDDAESAAEIRRVVEFVDRLAWAAAERPLSEKQRLLASRKLQAVLERELLKSRGRREH